ncbi:hypothetical protein GCM10017709_29280 [Glutamicibacter nicotianae]
MASQIHLQTAFRFLAGEEQWSLRAQVESTIAAGSWPHPVTQRLLRTWRESKALLAPASHAGTAPEALLIDWEIRGWPRPHVRGIGWRSGAHKAAGKMG